MRGLERSSAASNSVVNRFQPVGSVFRRYNENSLLHARRQAKG